MGVIIIIIIILMDEIETVVHFFVFIDIAANRGLLYVSLFGVAMI